MLRNAALLAATALAGAGLTFVTVGITTVVTADEAAPVDSHAVTTPVTPRVTTSVTPRVTPPVTTRVTTPAARPTPSRVTPDVTPTGCAIYGDYGPEREQCDDAKEQAADDGGEVGADEWCNPGDPGYPCDPATMPPLPTATPSATPSVVQP